jgi:Phage gp6-like head-tail connector protein
MDDLATLAQVKAYAGVVGSADDNALKSLITGYSDWIRQYTNRDFSITSYTVKRDGRDQIAMMLPDWPIISVQSVKIDGLSVAAQSTFGSTGYRFDERSIILNNLCFTRGRSNVDVAYTAGYATIPATIAQALCELVALRYKERDRIGFSSKSLAGETVSFITKAMPDSVKLALAQFAAVVPV